MSDQMMMVPQGNGAVQTRQGFGEQSLERKSSAATAMAARAQAEVQARYIVAMQRPRNVEEFRVRLLDHCKRLRFAQAARYKKPVGKHQVNGRWETQFIEGASIRFVETALCEYSNVLPESTIIYEDDEQVIVRVTVTDLERNITHSGEATIRKRMERRSPKPGQQVLGQRMNSKGDIVYLVEATDDDVANLKAARESKLMRNLGLRILPADVVAEAMDSCIAAQQADVAKDPAAARRAIVDAFHGIGVPPTSLVEYLGHPLEQVVPAELVELREHYQAIKDGEATWSSIMATKGGDATPAAAEGAPAPAGPPKGVAAAKEQLRKSAKSKQPASAEGGPSSPAEPTPTPAAEGDEGDPVEVAIEYLWSQLETILRHPERLPAVKKDALALPKGDDRDGLLKAIAEAEKEIGS